MSLNQCQKDVDERTAQFQPQYFPPANALAQMTEELWEVARQVNFIDGVKKAKNSDELTKKLWEEIADLLFSTVCLANINWIDLDAEWNSMMRVKRYGRDNDRFEKKE